MAPGPEDPALEAVLEFLEAWVHEVLFARGLYPPALFERRRLYGVAARRARHPELAAYVAAAAGGLRGALAAGALDRVAVAVAAPGGAPAERHVLEARLLARAPGAPAADPAEAEARLRGCLLRLQHADAALPPPPAGATWELVAHAAGRAALDAGAWIEEGGGGGGALRGAEAVPVHACRLEDAFALQLWAEAPPPP
jgi:hypothetical protein